MSNGNSKVTVLMPVYNGERYLREAIESILNQTFTDFEFLIINDGSTDSSVEIIESYNDPRIRLVHNEKNLKLIATLNKGIDLAQGEYIARMDCDDISLPERLEEQVEFMDANLAYALCGSWVEVIDENNVPTGLIWKYEGDHNKILAALLSANQFAHSTVILRKSILTQGFYYDANYAHAEDYELWLRIADSFKVSNIQKPLVKYRVHSTSITGSKYVLMDACVRNLICAQIRKLNFEPSAAELDLHCNLERQSLPTKGFVKQADAWLQKLRLANARNQRYPEPAFSQRLGELWFTVCDSARGLGLWTWRKFLASPLSHLSGIGWKQKIKFGVICLLRRSR